LVVQGSCDSALKPVPADAVFQIVSQQELLPGQCVIYGVGRILTIKVEANVWVDAIVVAQESPSKQLWGDAGGFYAWGTGRFALSVESGSLYLTRVSMFGRTGVDTQTDVPNPLAALQIGEHVTAAYISGACASALPRMQQNAPLCILVDCWHIYPAREQHKNSI
jgi:hypothetical protein